MIILGSSSMARRQILTEMGYEFTIMADAIVSRLKTTAQFEVEAHSTLLITADTTTCWVLGWHIHLVLHNIYILCLL
ncbi:hypothetical protein I3843_01G035600 [Carya illinoinensis]|nr:hypothetical protein I3843_01G035600 [Carya illinoinensis]